MPKIYNRIIKKMPELSLVILAAGMGSRYGGPKQFDILLDNKTLLHHSLRNAEEYFDNFIFVLRQELVRNFEEKFEDFINSHKCHEAIQFKPYGTAHAVLMATKYIKGPFAVINADDYYGKNSFKKLNNFLSNIEDYSACMVGYKLNNTLSNSGSVNRGICKISEDYKLQEITETKKITKDSKIDMNSVTSMNLFGFSNHVLRYFGTLWYEFWKKNVLSNGDQIEEFMLPDVVSYMIHNKNIPVDVLMTDDRWVGLTYKEDRNEVIQYLCNL